MLKLKPLLILIALLASSAWAESRLAEDQPLPADMGTTDGSSSRLRIDFTKTLTIDTQLRHGPVLNLHKGIPVAQEALAKLDDSVATYCRLVFGRPYQSGPIELRGSQMVDDVFYASGFSYASLTRVSAIKGSATATIQLEDGPLLRLIIERRAIARSDIVDPKKFDRALMITPAAIKDCLGESVQVTVVPKK